MPKPAMLGLNTAGCSAAQHAKQAACVAAQQAQQVGVRQAQHAKQGAVGFLTKHSQQLLHKGRCSQAVHQQEP